MNRYQLFYHPHVLGDVLMVIIAPSLNPTNIVRHEDIVLLYHDDTLIGINIFNILPIMKIHTKGMIYSPPHVLIQIINDLFANAAIDVYLPPFASGFIISRVNDCRHIDGDIYRLTLDIAVKQAVVSFNQRLDIGTSVIVVEQDTILPNGKLANPSFYGADEQYMICRDDDLFESGDMKAIIIEDSKVIGSDYFSKE